VDSALTSVLGWSFRKLLTENLPGDQNNLMPQFQGAAKIKFFRVNADFDVVHEISLGNYDILIKSMAFYNPYNCMDD